MKKQKQLEIRRQKKIKQENSLHRMAYIKSYKKYMDMLEKNIQIKRQEKVKENVIKYEKMINVKEKITYFRTSIKIKNL